MAGRTDSSAVVSLSCRYEKEARVHEYTCTGVRTQVHVYVHVYCVYSKQEVCRVGERWFVMFYLCLCMYTCIHVYPRVPPLFAL